MKDSPDVLHVQKLECVLLAAGCRAAKWYAPRLSPQQTTDSHADILPVYLERQERASKQACRLLVLSSSVQAADKLAEISVTVSQRLWIHGSLTTSS